MEGKGRPMAIKRKAVKRSGRVSAEGAVSSARTLPPRARRATDFRSFVAANAPLTSKIGAIRAGVRARIVNEMVAYLDVPKNVIFGLLHTPESTAHRLIKDDRKLDPAASEGVVRVADITRMAEETFGGRDAARRWLKTANLALGGAPPLSMLDTEPGTAEVRRILSSINHGGVL
jgi:putative toxin-antitoxin system antitoxin component (TIGR02293 family)